MPRTHGLAGVAVLAVLATVAGTAPAAFVAVANHTDAELRFSVVHPVGKPETGSLAAGECRLIPVGQQPEIQYAVAGKEARYRLTPYSAYVFTRTDQGIAIHRVEFSGALPKSDDVPERPAKTSPLKLTVKLCVDDSDPRARAVWEKVLRERAAAVSENLERQCGIAIEVVAVGEWSGDPEATDLETLARNFERSVKPTPADVAIGFTSRPLDAAGKDGAVLTCGGPDRTHILMHEPFPRTEPERVEVLLHLLAHRLGAAHVPDPNSAMRRKLGDGKATSANFRPGLDPLNTLAVGLWAEARRARKDAGWADLPPRTLSRLLIVYRTLQELSPNDPLVEDYLAKLDRVRTARGAVNPEKIPGKPAVPDPIRPPAPAGPELTAIQEAARKIVRTISFRAADLSQLPPAQRPTGDRLTVELVRAAADTAVTLEENLQAPAFLIGLGLGLDDSSILRSNPLTRRICGAIESDDERKERLAALGSPTMHGRRDLCQHFVVSAALTELLGPGAAEAAGLSKELLDMGRDSGFSFADLAADYAGVAFAKKMKSDNVAIRIVRAEFRIADYVPDPAGLAEGLNRQRFETEFGGVSDPRFKTAVETVRKRVADLPAYRK